VDEKEYEVFGGPLDGKVIPWYPSDPGAILQVNRDPDRKRWIPGSEDYYRLDTENDVIDHIGRKVIPCE